MRPLAITVLLAAFCSSTVAQEELTERADNAALWYWRAFTTLGQYNDGPMEAINAVMMSEGEDAAGRRDVRMYLANLIPDLQLAARQSTCVFAVDWDGGFMATFPHLNSIQHTFQLLEADATGAITTGDDERAVNRMMLMLSLADHTSQEPAALSCFLATRFVASCADLQAKMNVAELSQDSRARLLSSWSLVEHIGPEHLAAAYTIHQFRTREASRRRWFGENGEELLREDFEMIVDIISLQSPRLGPYDTLEIQFELWQLLDDAIVDAMDNRNRARLDEIALKLGNGEYGWLAQGLTSDFIRPYEAMIQAEETIRNASRQ